MSKAFTIIRATPRGRGAIATLFLAGQEAFAILVPCLVFPHHDQNNATQGHSEDNAPVFAYFQLGNAREEVVVDFRRHNRIALHCHGGDAVVNAIETALVERGAVARTWQDWLAESGETGHFPHHKPLDRIQREAMQLLPFAETELTAKLLLAQYHGALSRRLEQMFQFLDCDKAEATAILDTLLQSYESGRHLTTPFRVGLIGPVNAGKSSLMNALLGFNRSITSQVAGTTRDAVSAKTVISGWPVTLIDTAGIRETSNPIEREGLSQMQTVIAESDLLLLVIDANAGQTGSLPEITSIPKRVPMIHVANKIDLFDQQATWPFQPHPDCVPVSALTGNGLDLLNDAISGKLHQSNVFGNSEANPAQTALIFTERQFSCLSSLRQKLEQGEIVSVISLKTALME